VQHKDGKQKHDELIFPFFGHATCL